MPIHQVPWPPLHLVLAQLNVLAAHIQVAIFQTTGSMSSKKISVFLLFMFDFILILFSLSRYLYQLALAVDANFCLKRKERGIQDKSLSDGLAYVVQSDTYTKFLDAVPDYNEVLFITIFLYLIYRSIFLQMNTCDSTLHAVDHANKKGIDGLAATGIGGVSCARHCFNRKLGFADLQKGKKYCLCTFLLNIFTD